MFCDESGGFGGNEHSFLVSAVRISDHDAGRLMKRLRKTFKAPNEIKGNSLTEKQRVTFFDMLSEIDQVAAVVTCQKTSALGAIVSKSHREHEIFEDMLVEACDHLVDFNAPVLRIVADGGRYKRPVHDKLAINAAGRLTRDGVMANVDFARSEEIAGIQVADIIANTVYKALTGGGFDTTSACGLLVQTKRIIVSSAGLPTTRPSWMTMAAE
ncbi:DUF3800 domain-containing protein (plasmid) [Rhizobium sp. T1470]|uniref:DUF3800 domain-containing protein n=1 Tax=Rhizobium sp. T1470 TaxID=555320 RepID=UPI001CD5AEBA|nr:DUF3800 domain-containing protein [Rhizobium sp. T1473]MCA0807324.1 DUF3800 domain-containing protein [Rhizobium sp. T1473]